MSKEMFCTRCDKCGEKSEQYTHWPPCRICGEDTCFDCDVESQRSSEDENRTTCRDCMMNHSVDWTAQPRVINRLLDLDKRIRESLTEGPSEESR